MIQKLFPILGLILIASAGCTPSTVTPVMGLTSGAKTVVIVPSLPPYLLVVTRGVTIFGNNLDTPSISDWNLEQLVYDTAKSALPANYSVAEYVPKGFLVDYQSRLDAGLDGDDGVAGLVKTYVNVSPPPDLYIVFCVSARDDPNPSQPGTPAFMQDIGVSHELPPWPLPPLPPVLHSFLEVTIIDGKTMKVIHDSPLIMPPGSNVTIGALMSHDEPYPEKVLKNFDWHDKWSDMTPAEREEIKSGIENMLTLATDYTVRQSFPSP